MTMNAPSTLMEAIQYFSNDAVCVEYMCRLRYDEAKPVCPHCGSLNVGNMNTRPKFQCREKQCRKQFSLKRGTLMEDSPVSLNKWLVAIWQVCNCKNGISSYELARALKVTQATAWFMLHRIRIAMISGTFLKLKGHVEIDETYVGGKAINMHKAKKEAKGLTPGRGHDSKTVVMGMVERGGQVVAKVVDNAQRRTLVPEIEKHVEEGSNVYTDALKSYDKLGEKYNHSSIDHKYEYVKGDTHTNTMENFWCLFKRSIKGTYVQVAPFHVDKYVTEQAFRYNERKTNDSDRFIKVVSQMFDRRLTYKELVGAEIT